MGCCERAGGDVPRVTFEDYFARRENRNVNVLIGQQF